MILDLVSELEEGEIFKPKIGFIYQATIQNFRNYNQYDFEFRGQKSAIGDWRYKGRSSLFNFSALSVYKILSLSFSRKRRDWSSVTNNNANSLCGFWKQSFLMLCQYNKIFPQIYRSLNTGYFRRNLPYFGIPFLPSIYVDINRSGGLGWRRG